MDEQQFEFEPFKSDDLWKRSAFDLKQLDTSLFDIEVSNDSTNPPAFRLEQLHLTDAFSIPELDNFTFGDLEDVNLATHSQKVAIDGTSSVSNPEGSDIWSLDLEKEDARKPRLRTWEAFLEPGKEPEEDHLYVSEAGPLVWDAILAEQAAKPETILEASFVCRSLALLGQGRSSRLFRYDTSNTLKPVVDGFRPSGISAQCFDSLVEHLNSIGSMFISLRTFVRTIYASRKQITVRVTFAQCVRTVLENLEQQLETSMSNVQSLLQLQAMYDRVHHVLSGLVHLQHSVTASPMEEKIIVDVRHAFAALKASAHPASLTLEVVVARVTRPLMVDLCAEIGLANTEDIRAGSTTTVRSLIQQDSQDPYSRSLEYGSDRNGPVSGLLNSQETELVREIMNGMDILKSHSSTHPLVAPSKYSIDLPLQDGSATLTNADALLEKARKYQDDISAALRSIKSLSSYEMIDAKSIPIDDHEEEQLPWSHDERQQQFFAEIGKAFVQPLVNGNEQTSDELCTALVVDMERSEEVAMTIKDDEDSSITESLLQPILPLLRIQSRLVNGSVLRMLLREQRLRRDLDVQYQFHLLGNGSFVSRLSSALFSSTSDSAEQRRGLVPSGSNLGLRLDTRDGQRWPPASSELRLTLTGILAETLTAEQSGKLSSKDLPGGLSFAVRELSNEDIDKIISPQSIHALDFLKIQYTPPSPLDEIITPASLEKYDDLFRFLLRLLRLIHLVSDLKTSLVQTSTSLQALFATSAHHIITTLSSNTLTLGIAGPWLQFTKTLSTIEQNLLSEDVNSSYGSRVTIGLSALASLHEETLDRIRSRLYLRQKQSRVRICIEHIMTTILDASTLLRSPTPSSIEEQKLRQSYKEMRDESRELIRCLDELSMKTSKARDGAAAEDAEAAAMLARMIDFNSFFGSFGDEQSM